MNSKFRFIILLSAQFLILFLFPSSTFAKSYSIISDKYNIKINSNKSVEIYEELTYDFSGSFSWADMWIPTRVEREGYTYDASITDFKVSAQDGSPVTLQSSGQKDDQFYAKWLYSAEYEKKTFIITYIIDNGVRKYPEVSEFYWQIIGQDWKIPHNNVEAVVNLPSQLDSSSEVFVYGHGPLSGKSEIVDLVATKFTAEYVSSGQFMEIRTIFPSRLIDGSIDDNITLENIKSEEEKIVRETVNAVKKTQIVQKGIYIWALFISPALFIFWIIFLYRTWKKHGKEYVISGLPEYVRELPSKLNPAEVEVLTRQGLDPTTRAFTATIFDLARKGFIKIEDEVKQKAGFLRTKQEYRTTLVERDRKNIGNQQLKDYEIKVLRLLFADIGSKGQVTLKEVKTWLKQNPFKFQSWFNNFQKSVKNHKKMEDFIESKSLNARRRAWIMAIVLTILSLNPIIIIIAVFVNRHIKRWDMKWAKEADSWKRFKRFLSDFGSFERMPPEAYKLWEHYLVFGILFGNAKKIIDMLPIILKDPQAVVPVWYTISGTRADVTTMSTESIASLVNSMNVFSSGISKASSSSAHYSSGSGGGFSSGGGGGGGGGGGSAG